MVPIASPIICKEEKESVLEVLNSGMIAQGPKLEEFEKKFADYCSAKYGIAANSGTAALHLALMAMGIKKGDEVAVMTLKDELVGVGTTLMGSTGMLEAKKGIAVKMDRITMPLGIYPRIWKKEEKT